MLPLVTTWHSAAEGPSEMSAGLAWREEALDGEDHGRVRREAKRGDEELEWKAVVGIVVK